MFSSLHRPQIIGLLLVAILVLAIIFAFFFFPRSHSQATDSTYQRQTVTYCSPENIPQLMDIYTPTNTAGDAASRPVVEMVHGGGWTAGSRGSINTI